jgi:hypothetical protein
MIIGQQYLCTSPLFEASFLKNRFYSPRVAFGGGSSRCFAEYFGGAFFPFLCFILFLAMCILDVLTNSWRYFIAEVVCN